jgi:KDO2-lipid IV(A) lauroyltransferase
MKSVLKDINYFLVKVLSLLPLQILYFISDIMYLFINYVIKYRKKVIYNNLKNSFPDKTDNEIKKLVKKFYRHFCDSLIETLALVSMSEKEIKKRMRYRNLEILDKYYKENKSVCAVFGHYGNWEWLAGLPFYCKHQVYAIYLPLTNNFFDELIKNARSKFGAKCIKKQSALYKIIENHNKGILTLTFFLGDQTPMHNEIGYWTNFLNQDTPVYLGVEKISKKTNQAVVFFKISKIKRGFYETEIINIEENPCNTDEFEITEKHVKLLESIISEKPEYWLWSHRRWKHKKI